MDLESLVTELPELPLAAPVERAGLASWPAASERVLDGLLLRFSEGYTRRANCANAYRAGAMAVEDRVAACEALYAAHALPPIFRLIGVWPQPALDVALAGQGYSLADVTHVLTLDLVDHAIPNGPAPLWRQGGARRWAEAYSQVSGATDRQRDPLMRILQDIGGERLLCGLGSPEQPVACGLGVIEGGLLGLFDIAVRPACRGQGHGRALVTAMLALGKASGVGVAYLQVTEANIAARSLYDSLGFQELYRYWYRQKPAAVQQA